jgi:hypothetical protein
MLADVSQRRLRSGSDNNTPSMEMITEILSLYILDPAFATSRTFGHRGEDTDSIEQLLRTTTVLAAGPSTVDIRSAAVRANSAVLESLRLAGDVEQMYSCGNSM